MLDIALGLIAAIAVTIFVIRLFARGAMHWSGQLVASRFRAAEHIVEKGTAPEEWVVPYRRKIEAIRLAKGDGDRVERVMLRARRRCARRLDELTRFFQGTPFVDTPGARHQLVRRLQDQRDRLEAEDWRTFLGLETGAPGKEQ